MIPRQIIERFGPRKHKERTGVPADHFVPTERPNYRKALREAQRELARRNQGCDMLVDPPDAPITEPTPMPVNMAPVVSRSGVPFPKSKEG